MMTANDLKKIRTRAGLSQNDLACMLLVARNTVNRWEMGKHPISPAMDKLIRLVCKNV